MFRKDRSKKFIIVNTLLFGAICFCIGFFAGGTVSFKDAVEDEHGEVEIKKVINLYSASRSQEVQFDRFWKVWDLVKDKYVDQPVSEVDMFYGAIEGMVAGLGDPHSVFMPPREAKEFAADMSGEFSGIGAEIGVRDGQIVVIAPLEDSPAQQAGLRPKDMIITINGEESQGLSAEQAAQKIRGPKGTDVELGILRPKDEKMQKVVITRDDIKVPTVIVKSLDGGIAHFRITYFNKDTYRQFISEADELIDQGVKGIVLDLRSNPGGFLTSAVDVADAWISQGAILQETFKDGKQQTYMARHEPILKDIPTVVLVDGGTASGSEIVAGALQDYGIGKIVGEKTYGKGSVQDFEVFPDASALKLTIAKWFTPKGRGIDKQGIEPDIVLDEMFVLKEGIGEKDSTTPDDYRDLGLEKALEILQ